MENIADALKMAVAVLIFVIALGISISSFSQAKQTAQTLLDYTDREYDMQYISNVTNTERVVGIETIIPTIYRAYKENYKVFFYNSDGQPLKLYSKRENGIMVDINYIDLEQETVGSDRNKDNFIMALLYGNKAKLKADDGTEISFYEFVEELKRNNSGISLNTVGIYDTIKENKFVEKFGVYYQDDLKKEGDDTSVEDTEAIKTPDVDKIKKRVISYYKQ